jgi:hypothetical protein
LNEYTLDRFVALEVRVISAKLVNIYPGSCAAMCAGDASFHYGWTLHGAPGNTTSLTREVMTVIWFADGTRVLAPNNPNRQRDLARWLNGIRPGELAAGPLNPVVFDRNQREGR